MTVWLTDWLNDWLTDWLNTFYNFLDSLLLSWHSVIALTVCNCHESLQLSEQAMHGAVWALVCSCHRWFLKLWPFLFKFVLSTHCEVPEHEFYLLSSICVPDKSVMDILLFKYYTRLVSEFWNQSRFTILVVSIFLYHIPQGAEL